MVRVHTGEADVFPALMQAVTPHIAVYRPWTDSPAAFEDLEQELWLALWNALQRDLPRILRPEGDPERSV